MPTEANGARLEGPINRANGQYLQANWQRTPDSLNLWLLVYRNRARMGIYADALRLAEARHTTPDIKADDRDGRHKYGAAIGMDWPLADRGDTGLFARAGWNDGRTESFVFTEADRNASAGIQVSGAHWSRSDDRFGFALAVNGLSPEHRAYLAAGGTGFTLGDGGLRYGSERIAEAYYAFAIHASAFITADMQWIGNPGYNRDRGPVRVIGLRIHLAY